jgi:hypothetical protein
MIRRMLRSGMVAALKLIEPLEPIPALCLCGTLALTACSAEAPRAETGRLTVGLAAEVDGVSYRLRDAQFDIVGPATLSIDTEDDPDATSVQRVLASGGYTLTLRDGWRLERRLSPELPFETVDATLVSPNPTSFGIAEDETANVAYVFSADGATVPIGRGNLNLTIQVAASGPPITPILTDRDAAQAVYSALVTQSNVYWGFQMAATAEGTAMEVLDLVETSGVPELILEPGAELPAPLTIQCPEGGALSATWSRVSPGVLNDAAADLRIEFDRCAGRQRPGEISWIAAEDEGVLRVRVVASPELTLRVSSVRYGEGGAPYVQSGRNRADMILAYRNVYSYEVSGTFTQNPRLAGAFSFTIDGRRSEESFFGSSDEPGGIDFRRSTATASLLRVSGSRNVENPAQRAMDFRFLSGALVLESAEPGSSSSLSFSFADFSLDVLERNDEGNSSASMTGVVSLDSTPAGAAPCAKGTYRLATLEPLLNVTDGLAGTPENIQGKLRLNDDVYATYERQQELRIVRGENAPVVYSSEVSLRSALSASLSCPDYF